MRMKRVVSILAVAVLVFGLTGCNAITIDGETENVSGEAAGNGSIGFSISTLNNPFFVTLSEGAKEKAKTEGEKLIVVDAGDDAAKQTSDIEDLISKNISVLIVNPVDSDAVAPAVKDAVSRGIKVISVDRGVNGVDVDCAIASDNVEGAKMATDIWYHFLEKMQKWQNWRAFPAPVQRSSEEKASIWWQMKSWMLFPNRPRILTVPRE